MARKGPVLLLLLLGTLSCGQLLSLLLTATGVAASRLATLGIHAPTTLALCNYLLLAIVFAPLFAYRRKSLQVPWYFYAILSIVDFEANYLVVKAYQYTTMTTILLLDRASLFFVLALTWMVLKIKYNLGQLGGVSICMVGVLVLFISDMGPSKKNDQRKDLIKGDMFVLLASFLYATSNVVEELLAKKNDYIELMAFLGLFGSLFSALQLYLLEISEIKSIRWNIYTVTPILGFAVSLFIFYIAVPFFLKWNGSTMFNLSLVTSDMWAMIIQKFSFHQKVGRYYFIAFTLVVLGLILYSYYSRSSKSENSSPNIEQVEQ